MLTKAPLGSCAPEPAWLFVHADNYSVIRRRLVQATDPFRLRQEMRIRRLEPLPYPVRAQVLES